MLNINFWDFSLLYYLKVCSCRSFSCQQSHCFFLMSQLMKSILQTWFNKVGSKETWGEKTQLQRETKIGKGKIIVCKLQVSEQKKFNHIYYSLIWETKDSCVVSLKYYVNAIKIYLTIRTKKLLSRLKKVLQKKVDFQFSCYMLKILHGNLEVFL